MFEPSQASFVRGNISVLYDSPSSPSLPPLSARLSFFGSVDFPQLFQLFNRYLDIASWENNGSSCFLDALPLWDNLTFIFPGNIEPGRRPNSILRARFIGSQSLREW